MTERDHRVSSSRIKILACATVLEELRPLMGPRTEFEVFDFGLHLRPEGLREALQDAVDAAAAEHDVVLLGYGLCSMAVVGLEANGCTLVIPRVDDCIAAFLGSQSAYREKAAEEPGTYYLTKGWIEVGDTLLDERRRLVDRYGSERADRMMAMMLKHYRRLVYIDTGHDDQEPYRRRARAVADHFGLEYCEVAGSHRLLLKLLEGDWDEDFVVVEPGSSVTFDAFTTGRHPVAPNLLGGPR